MILRVFTNSMVTRRQAFWGARQSLCFGPIYTWHPTQHHRLHKMDLEQPKKKRIKFILLQTVHKMGLFAPNRLRHLSWV